MGIGEKLEGITSIHVFLIPTRSAGIESGPGLGFDQVGKLHLQNRADPVEGVNGGIPLPTLDLAEIGRGDLSVKGQVFLRNIQLVSPLPDPGSDPFL